MFACYCQVYFFIPIMILFSETCVFRIPDSRTKLTPKPYFVAIINIIQIAIVTIYVHSMFFSKHFSMAYFYEMK